MATGFEDRDVIEPLCPDDAKLVVVTLFIVFSKGRPIENPYIGCVLPLKIEKDLG
jgi:hypothetical protein